MAFFRTVLLLCAASWVNAVATPLESSVEVRNAPGKSLEDTWLAIRRGLAAASLEKRESFTAELPLERSWSGATLLSIGVEKDIPQNNPNSSLKVEGALEVTCQTCYVKGHATTELTINGDFNASELILNATGQVSESFSNFTDTFERYLDNYTDSVKENILDDGVQLSDFAFPTFDIAFDLDVPPVPDTNLRIQFDDMELYLELNTALSAGATYEINLFATQTPVGIKVGPYLQLGALLAVDLILAVEGAIDISSGFHIKLDDGITLDIALFGDRVSNMEFNGGQFEFLPVTLESASVSMSAFLRIGAHCGVEVVTPEPTFFPTFEALNTTIGPPSFTAGIEIAVFANVAEFVTSVTYAPDDEECELKVVQEYNLAVGALAGASAIVEFLDETKSWGPVIDTSTAIFTTTLAEVCAMQATATAVEASITPAPERRQDLTETVISTELTGTGVSCKVTGVANCPNSEQVTTKTVFESTITTSVPSGEEATWPASTFDTVQSTIAFGSQVRSIKALSGSPTPYVAPPGTEDGDDSDDEHGLDEQGLNGETGGVSNKVIIGVCVGLIIPILAAIIAAVVFFRRRKRYAAVGDPPAPMVANPYTGHTDYKDQVQETKGAGQNFSELRR